MNAENGKGKNMETTQQASTAELAQQLKHKQTLINKKMVELGEVMAELKRIQLEDPERAQRLNELITGEVQKDLFYQLKVLGAQVTKLNDLAGKSVSPSKNTAKRGTQKLRKSRRNFA